MKYLVLISLLLSFNTIGKTVKLASYMIPYYITSEGDGAFVKMLKEIEKRKNIQIKLKLYAPSRALQLFRARNETNAYFPSVRPKETNNVLVSDSFYQKIDGIFVKKDYEETDTKKMRVCVTRLYPQENLIHDKVESLRLTRMNFPQDCFKEIIEGRSDAFVGEVTTTLDLIAANHHQDFKVLNYPFEKVPVHFLFPKDSEGEENLKIFNEAIKELKDESLIQKLMNTDRFKELYQSLKS